jgi:Zn-dependent M28 family amino/carboxypeptidase
MFIRNFILFIVLIQSFPTFADGKSNESYYQRIVGALAHDSMQGREVSTKYEDKAANYISKEVARLLNRKTNIHTFSFVNSQNQQSQQSKNVYYFKDNHALKTILISAHYDHLGLGGLKSLSYGKRNQVHNGADDNASGVALTLSLCKELSTWKSKQYNYLFVWYSAHEIGLYGSSAFKQYCESMKTSIALVLNFDMVGRLDHKVKIMSVYGFETLKGKDNYIYKQNSGITIRANENDMIYQTDGGAFASAGISALSFTTGVHEDYHKVSDDANTLNYEGMVEIQDLMEDFIKQLNL